MSAFMERFKNKVSTINKYGVLEKDEESSKQSRHKGKQKGSGETRSSSKRGSRRKKSVVSEQRLNEKRTMPSPRVRRAAQASASRMQSNEARLSKELDMEDSLASNMRDSLSSEGTSHVPANHVRSAHKAPLASEASGTKPKKRYKKPTLADLRQMDNLGSSFRFDASPVRDKAPARNKRDVPSSPLSPPNFNGTHGPRSFSKDLDTEFTGGRLLASPRYPQPTHSHANSPHDRHGDNRTDYDNYGGDSVYGDADSYGQSVPYRDHDMGQHGGDEDPLGWSGEERVIPQLHPEIDPYEQERRYQQRHEQQHRRESVRPRRHTHAEDYDDNHQAPRQSRVRGIRKPHRRHQRRQTPRELRHDKARAGHRGHNGHSGHHETGNTGFSNFVSGPPSSKAVTRPEAKEEHAKLREMSYHQRPNYKVKNESAIRNEELSKKSEKAKLYFSKHSRKVSYKPKTLKDYRKIKPKNYQELGKLQPDLNREDLVKKRANQQRIKEFSEKLRSVNQKVEQTLKANRAGHPRRRPKAKHQPTKNEKMKAYASRVPKPAVRKPPKREVKPKTEAELDPEQDGPSLSLLEQLELEHQALSEGVESIRREHLTV